MSLIKIREVVKEKSTKKFELKKDTNGIITLDRNIMLDIFEIYMKNEFTQDYTLETGEYIAEIIKVHLPKEKLEALDILSNGVDFDNNHYVYLTTSAGLMKKSNTEFKTECEVFFIEDTYQNFRYKFEDVISLGKLESKKNTELCINKDVVSRVSLALSSCIGRVHIPKMKVAILPEMEYTFINNYLKFPSKVVKNDKGKDVEVIDLEEIKLMYEVGLDDVILDKFTKEDQLSDPIKHIALDGAGFVTPNMAATIKSKLNETLEKSKKIDYHLSWFGIRSAMATKGLLVKFDFKKYLKEEHGLNKLIVKDFWGNDVDLMKVDVIMNASMTKWCKWFESHEEYKNLIQDDKYNEYREILESLYIVKVNKEQAKHATETNYQILSNLALTEKELDDIAAEEDLMFKNAILETDEDISWATRRLMLGDVAREDQNELSASTKAHKLLQLDSEMNKTASTFELINRLVNKKVNEFAGGSIYIRGNYKTIIKDPISYFESLVEVSKNQEKYIYKIEKDKQIGEEIKILKGIKGQISEKGLKCNTNYVAGETGKRVLGRCPLNSPGELIRTELVKNEILEKYFGDLSNDIIFYSFDDTMMKQSGADEDLDITLVINNDVIYNAVIEDKDENGDIWYFYNQFDGDLKEDVYNDSNLYEAILSARGNKIGFLSNIGTVCSGSRMQKQLPNLKLKDGTIISEFELINGIHDKYKQKLKIINGDSYINEEDKCELQKGLIERERTELERTLAESEIVEYTEEQHRENILKNFKSNKVHMYFLLYSQMKAIDSPKTGLSIDEEVEFITKHIAKGKNGKKEKKPRYVYHAKYKQKDKVVKYYEVTDSDSLLNNFCRRIMKKYGFKAREVLSKRYKDKKLIDMLRGIEVEKNEELIDKITKINNDYHDKLDSVEVEIDGKLIKINKDINNLKEKRKDIEYKNDESYALQIEDKINKLYNLRRPAYDRILLETDEIIRNEIIDKYTTKEILRSLGEAKGNKEYCGNKVNIKSTFITTYFFDQIVEYMIETCKDPHHFDEDENGKYRYLFKNYSKQEINISNDQLGKKEINRIGIKNGDTVSLKTDLRSFSEEDKNKINTNEIKVVTFKDGYLFTENEDKIQISLGKVHDNSNKGKYYPEKNREFKVHSAYIYPNRNMDKAGIEFSLWY